MLQVNTRFLLYNSRRSRRDTPLLDVAFTNMTSIWHWAGKAFNVSAPTKVIVHGFGSSCSNVWVYEMRSALMDVVSWRTNSAFSNPVIVHDPDSPVVYRGKGPGFSPPPPDIGSGGENAVTNNYEKKPYFFNEIIKHSWHFCLCTCLQGCNMRYNCNLLIKTLYSESSYTWIDTLT